MKKCRVFSKVLLVLMLWGCAGGAPTSVIIQVVIDFYRGADRLPVDRSSWLTQEVRQGGLFLSIGTNCNTRPYDTRDIVVPDNLIVSIMLEAFPDAFLAEGTPFILQDGVRYELTAAYVSNVVPPEFLSWEKFEKIDSLSTTNRIRFDSSDARRFLGEGNSVVVLKLVFKGMPNVKAGFLLSGLNMQDGKGDEKMMRVYFSPLRHNR